MKKNTLSFILDFLLLFIILFFISFVWTRYVVKNLVASLFISISFSLIITLIRIRRENKKQAKLKSKKEQSLHIQDCADAFMFNSFEENAQFYKTMLEKKYRIEIKNSFLYLENDIHKIALFLLFDVKKINQDQVIFCLKSVKKYNLTKIILICNNYDNNVLNITKNYKIKTIILNSTQNYNEILKIYNTYPQLDNKLRIDEKISFSFLLKNAINKKKFKSYFVGGIFLFIASLFVKYNIYYIIFSSIMFILSILCLFSNKIYKTSKTEVL